MVGYRELKEPKAFRVLKLGRGKRLNHGWIYGLCLWLCGGILPLTARAVPQTKIQYHTIDTLFGARYFINSSKSQAYAQDTQLHINYKTGERRLSFLYHFGGQARDQLRVRTLKQANFRTCTSQESHDVFTHSQLGRLHLCQSRLRGLRQQIFIQGVTPQNGLLFQGEYTGAPENLSLYLYNIRLYNPYPRQSFQITMNQDFKLYQWLYPDEQSDAFQSSRMPLREVNISWRNDDYPHMQYLFKKEVSSPLRLSQSSPSNLYTTQTPIPNTTMAELNRRSWLRIDYAPRSRETNCSVGQTEMTFAYHPANYRLCLSEYNDLYGGSISAPFAKEKPTTTLTFQLPHQELQKVFQLLRSQGVLY